MFGLPLLIWASVYTVGNRLRQLYFLVSGLDSLLDSMGVLLLSFGSSPLPLLVYQRRNHLSKVKYASSMTKKIKNIREFTNPVIKAKCKYSFELIHPFSRKALLYFFSHHLAVVELLHAPCKRPLVSQLRLTPPLLAL